MVDDGDGLLLALDGFFTEHRRCGELDGGVDDVPGGYVVWLECGTCGAQLQRRGAQP